MAREGYIYILSNKGMKDGLFKIGKTVKENSKTPVEDRMKELYKTGVPFPFTCEYAVKVEDVDFAEKQIHLIFKNDRVPTNREFFTMSLDQAIAVLDLAKIERYYVKEEKTVDSIDDLNAIDQFGKQLNQKRPNFKFSTANIPTGSTIYFTRDESFTATVASDSKVEYQGEEYSLSSLAKKLLDENNYPTRGGIQGALFFKYKDPTRKILNSETGEYIDDSETLHERRLRLETLTYSENNQDNLE